MKKILIAFDGTQFSDGAFEFAKKLNELQPILLTGVFIPQVSYANLWSYGSEIAGPLYGPLVMEDDKELIEKNIIRFQSLCQKNNIVFKVHKDFNDFALPELKKETRFADLLIISSEKFFEDFNGPDAIEYMKDAIHQAECPVIVIPEKYTFPTQNIIAYDGSPSSIHALKQFAYLFPELSRNETLLVYSKSENDLKIPNENYIEELAAQHYNKLSLLKLEVNPRKYFNSWLKDENNPIVICGSYGRSSFSQMFKKSFVAEVITDQQLPVFIAHL
ncbi:MAG: universal stress protein [Flavitalea sp.]